ncbi:MAG: FKBP-type peptidyl-prolyl cis-trans isomerase [Lentimicrobiaceae bacterium]|nr:FKBP-type peptidyl-prolyl cis-trans isomerase [Lentimicrobiaceae bacterium]
MKKLSFVALATTAVILIFAACGEKKFRGYKKTETGLYYKITTKNDAGRVPQEGDFLHFVASYDADFDSMFVFPPQEMQDFLKASFFKGDLYEAYALLKEGEEGEFLVQADSFFHYFSMMGIPPQVKPEDKLHFKIKMEKVLTREEFEVERAVKEKEYQEMAAKAKEEEKSLLDAYIAEQKIAVKPTESGLYFIENQKGKGVKAEKGKLITIHFVGKLLDGTVFVNTQEEGGEPAEFVLNDGMPGLIEGLLLMKAGGKATLILPSDLAYGEHGAGEQIPPFTPVIFEIELVKVSDAAPAAPVVNP